MFPPPSRGDVQREAMERMLNLVRHNAQNDASTNPVILDTSTSTAICVDEHGHVDLSFYKLREDEKDESVPESRNVAMNYLFNNASLVFSLNMQHNYLSGPHLFLSEENDEKIVRELQSLTVLDLSHNEYHEFDLTVLNACASSLQVLDISYNNLKTFVIDPSVEFTRLTHLLLGNNRKLSSFSMNMPNIVEIDLSSNRVTTDAVQTIFVGEHSLANLKIIRLNHNQLTGESFPAVAGSFVQMPSLEELYLEENEIESLSEEWLRQSKISDSLKIISLSYNKLQKLNDVLFNENVFSALVHILVDNNKLTHLPSVVKHENSEHSSTIETIGLHNNAIEVIDPSLFVLWSHISDISLQNNKLASIPEEIGLLKNIGELYLFNNNLAALPPTIGDLKQLVELDLYHNRLEALPAQIGQLTNLKRLNLEDNNLQTLPNEIVNLTNLYSFTLKNNPQLQVSPFVMMMRTDK